MSEKPEFREFPSIPRLSREMIVTEKLDGTNASVLVQEDGRVVAGCRSRWLILPDDNFEFAAWVSAHADELREGLGVGHHFGEWWGAKIQRAYGLTERRFSLFNVRRWAPFGVPLEADTELPRTDPHVSVKQRNAPACCGVVPILYRGVFDTAKVEECLAALLLHGSAAAPGFMKPEGVVVAHVSGNLLFKKTLDRNDGHKGTSR